MDLTWPLCTNANNSMLNAQFLKAEINIESHLLLGSNTAQKEINIHPPKKS